MTFLRKHVGGLFVLAGVVLVCTEIYLWWQDGVWNRFPFSELIVAMSHFTGQMMGHLAPLFQGVTEGLKGFEISSFPNVAQSLLGSIPVALLFLITGYWIWRGDRWTGRV